MKLRIDKDADALYLRLSEAEISGSEEVKPDVILDFDQDENIVAVEILNLSKHIKSDNVQKLNFETA